MNILQNGLSAPVATLSNAQSEIRLRTSEFVKSAPKACVLRRFAMGGAYFDNHSPVCESNLPAFGHNSLLSVLLGYTSGPVSELINP